MNTRELNRLRRAIVLLEKTAIEFHETQYMYEMERKMPRKNLWKARAHLLEIVHAIDERREPMHYRFIDEEEGVLT